jgi:hypothetical protein
MMNHVRKYKIRPTIYAWPHALTVISSILWKILYEIVNIEQKMATILLCLANKMMSKTMKIYQLYACPNTQTLIFTVLWLILLYAIFKVEQKWVAGFFHLVMKSWHTQLKLTNYMHNQILSLLYLRFCGTSQIML